MRTAGASGVVPRRLALLVVGDAPADPVGDLVSRGVSRGFVRVVDAFYDEIEQIQLLEQFAGPTALEAEIPGDVV